MTATKTDLSREAVEQDAHMLGVHAMMIRANHMTHPIADALDKAADTLRALLDRAEAAEAEHRFTLGLLDKAIDERDEARASVGAAWEAGRDDAAARVSTVGAHEQIMSLTNPDPSAAESLRRVKAKCWHEGNNSLWRGPNPYAAKEAAE